MLLALTAAIATTLTAGTAAADGFIEAIVGLAIPVADDDYDDVADESLKLGVRAGGGGGPSKLELAADFTPVNLEFDGNATIDTSAERYRVLVGVRHLVPAGNANLFVRLGAGVDIVHAAAFGSVFGVDYKYTETDLGIAAEAGMGVSIPLGGKLYLGGHFAIPMAFHFDEDDPDDQTDVSVDYTAIDIDLLFTIGTVQ